MTVDLVSVSLPRLRARAAPRVRGRGVSPLGRGWAMPVAALLLLLAALPVSAQAVVSGTCLVIDGDTINVIASGRTTRVRLQGIAAPEVDQRGGREAAAFLERLADGKPVKCELMRPRTDKFEIGTCHVGGQDLSAAVVRAGLARDCPRFSGGRYRAVESPRARALHFPDYCRP